MVYDYQKMNTYYVKGCQYTQYLYLKLNKIKHDWKMKLTTVII